MRKGKRKIRVAAGSLSPVGMDFQRPGRDLAVIRVLKPRTLIPCPPAATPCAVAPGLVNVLVVQAV